MGINKIIRILVAVVVVSCTVICILLLNNPQKIIEKKLGLKLPTTSQIVKYRYNWFDGFFEAKIKLEKKYINIVDNDLCENFEQEKDRRTEINVQELSLNYKPEWWNVNDEILMLYKDHEIGPERILRGGIMTVKKIAIISKQSDGNYYLYLDFVIIPREVIFS